jgi:hypothetical protein
VEKNFLRLCCQEKEFKAIFLLFSFRFRSPRLIFCRSERLHPRSQTVPPTRRVCLRGKLPRRPSNSRTVARQVRPRLQFLPTVQLSQVRQATAQHKQSTQKKKMRKRRKKRGGLFAASPQGLSLIFKFCRKAAEKGGKKTAAKPP